MDDEKFMVLELRFGDDGPLMGPGITLLLPVARLVGEMVRELVETAPGPLLDGGSLLTEYMARIELLLLAEQLEGGPVELEPNGDRQGT